MSKKVAIIISPNWQDYAKKYLADCLESLRRQGYQGGIKVFIPDNESSEESFWLLKKMAPEAEIIRIKENSGFARGNNEAIKLALKQGFDYIILFNMDTIIKENCVNELVKVAESDKKIGAVQAWLMLWPDKEKINSLGNVTHFLGFGYCLGYGQRMSDVRFRISDICYPSGAAVLFKAEVLKKVGLFDEEFWMYNEDQDLGWRIWLAGWRCVLAPEAVVYHKYEFAKSIKQYYFMDRNRMLSIVKNYHWLTLVLITPACLVMEFGLLLFSTKTGWFKEKIKVWLYFLNPQTWKYLIKARREAQSLRQVKDRDIVKMFSGKVWYQEIGDGRLKVANIVFDIYWQMVRFLIRW
ncbi:MAG: glycosyltransferase family 2 protein [Patescibacteria group bacterium]|nr:glycosyltransferase family 2 protein [Patescibacteria group bacterium]MDD5294312.1 glycosyltransferase family 2 protein [Patescibacteria group bacterium]MDD5554135.1 glycosyltransferase family 2 protein [Patescibacteria group bacterium]